MLRETIRKTNITEEKSYGGETLWRRKVTEEETLRRRNVTEEIRYRGETCLIYGISLNQVKVFIGDQGSARPDICAKENI